MERGLTLLSRTVKSQQSLLCAAVPATISSPKNQTALFSDLNIGAANLSYLHIKKGTLSQKRSHLFHGSLCSLYKCQQYWFYAQTQFKLVSHRTKSGAYYLKRDLPQQHPTIQHSNLQNIPETSSAKCGNHRLVWLFEPKTQLSTTGDQSR